MLDNYLYKKAAGGSSKEVAGALQPFLRAVFGGLTGGVAATEAGAMYRNEEHNITNLKPAILEIGTNEEVQKDFALGLGMGAAHGMNASGKGAATVTGLTWGTMEPSIRNAATGLYLQGTNAETQASNSIASNIILGTLGVGALGLGGYALYKYLSRKEEEKAAPPKVKVRIKGSDKDPYDDATVEVPLHNLKVTHNLEQGVNKSMRRVLRENNKFSGKKKDPITGKLISYQEYVDKYGEPVKNKKKKFTPDLAPTYTGPTLENNTLDQEVQNMDSINTYDQYNASI